MAGPRTTGPHLDWDGTWNARDLGSLSTADGRRTRPGALVRSEHLGHLTARGWEQLRRYGVRTVVDLRTAAEVGTDRASAPPELDVVRVDLEDGLADDPEFAGWEASGLLGTPLYYPRFLARWPDRCARAVAAVADAAPGGVLVHCQKGCDRTGLVVLLVLTLLGVRDDLLVEDYAWSATRLATPRAAALGRPDDTDELDAVRAAHGVRDVGESVRVALRSWEPLRLLREGGLTRAHEHALRARLLEA